MTRICIPIFLKGSNTDLEETLAQAEDLLTPLPAQDSQLKTQDLTPGMIELRADTASPKSLLAALDLIRLPVIVTIRPTWEGGFSTKPDTGVGGRLELWEAAMEAGADYIDVELLAWEKSKSLRDTLTGLAEKHGTRLILSNHHFEGRPKDLQDRLKRLRAIKQAHTLKLAWKATSLLDAIDALKLTQDSGLKTQDSGGGRPLVALAMGEPGLLSRLLAKKFNAPFTFASLQSGKESAPGQPTASELLHLYRWNAPDGQSPDTPTFGVAGFPIAHSLSPHLHNAGFSATNFPGIYVPLLIQPPYQAFKETLDALRALPNLNLRGLSVTIPHKENASRYLTENAGHIDETSKKIGVINTLLFPQNRTRSVSEGSPRGLNTDYAGALDALVTAWTGHRSDVKNKRIAVIGAGGAARAIIAGLAANGATVVVYNRTLEKAQTLAKEFSAPSSKVVAAAMEKLCDSCCHAYINCTPLGMHPHINTSPLDNLPHLNFTPDTVVFDTVYNPHMTKLLKQAQKAGAKIITGDEMFIRQAALQFKEFTAKDAPLDTFRKVLHDALNK